MLSLIFIFLFSCSEELSNNSNTPAPTYSPIGKWEVTMYPEMSEEIPDTTTVFLTFTDNGTDTTFSIVVDQKIEMLGVMTSVYESDGTVSVSGTTLTAIGTNCWKLDEEISADVCETPFSISTTGLSETEWKISGTSLATLPFITDELKTQLALMVIIFSKVNE